MSDYIYKTCAGLCTPSSEKICSPLTSIERNKARGGKKGNEGDNYFNSGNVIKWTQVKVFYGQNGVS